MLLVPQCASLLEFQASIPIHFARVGRNFLFYFEWRGPGQVWPEILARMSFGPLSCGGFTHRIFIEQCRKVNVGSLKVLFRLTIIWSVRRRGNYVLYRW